jgi:vacuolar-type H+-ATPase subunit E/Vma4
MALEDIFRALQEQADRDVEAVLAEARAHASVILEEAEREAATARETKIADAERSAMARSAQDINSVRLEVRKRIAGVKERAVSEVFETALTRLGEVRSRPDYAVIFKALADEATAGLSSGYEVLVDPADVEVATAYLRERGSSASVRGDLSTAGGLVVSTDGGSVMRRNTLEDRLDKLRGLAQADVAEIVFA